MKELEKLIVGCSVLLCAVVLLIVFVGLMKLLPPVGAEVVLGSLAVFCIAYPIGDLYYDP